NAIIIRATQGKPLIANKFPSQSSSIASMDAGLFILGGIGKAAELVNVPDTQLVSLPTNTTTPATATTPSTTSNSTTLTTLTQPRRNLAAGVVEGGITSIVPQ
ncbi:MAG: TrbI/VirB10 family protein, partial [Nostoc sp.]